MPKNSSLIRCSFFFGEECFECRVSFLKRKQKDAQTHTLTHTGYRIKDGTGHGSFWESGVMGCEACTSASTSWGKDMLLTTGYEFIVMNEILQHTDCLPWQSPKRISRNGLRSVFVACLASSLLQIVSPFCSFFILLTPFCFFRCIIYCSFGFFGFLFWIVNL